MSVHNISVARLLGTEMPYSAFISSDGTTLNIVPNDHSYLQHPDHRVTTDILCRGTYYKQTDSWFLDRLQFFGHRDFSAHLRLPIALRSTKHGIIDNAFANATSNKVLQWEIGDMSATQPRELDTYIPAAVNAMGFMVYAFGFNRESQTFKIMLIPSVPTSRMFDPTAIKEPVTIIPEPSRIVLLDAIYKDGLAIATGSFVMSAMGGTIPFPQFKTFIEVDPQTGNFSGEFVSQSSCLKIKGSGESYQFSSEVINKLCDPTMRIFSIGSYRGIPMTPTTYMGSNLQRTGLREFQYTPSVQSIKSVVTCVRGSHDITSTVVESKPVTIKIRGSDPFMLWYNDEIVRAL